MVEEGGPPDRQRCIGKQFSRRTISDDNIQRQGGEEILVETTRQPELHMAMAKGVAIGLAEATCSTSRASALLATWTRAAMMIVGNDTQKQRPMTAEPPQQRQPSGQQPRQTESMATKEMRLGSTSCSTERKGEREAAVAETGDKGDEQIEIYGTVTAADNVYGKAEDSGQSTHASNSKGGNETSGGADTNSYDDNQCDDGADHECDHKSLLGGGQRQRQAAAPAALQGQKHSKQHEQQHRGQQKHSERQEQQYCRPPRPNAPHAQQHGAQYQRLEQIVERRAMPEETMSLEARGETCTQDGECPVSKFQHSEQREQQDCQRPPHNQGHEPQHNEQHEPSEKQHEPQHRAQHQHSEQQPHRHPPHSPPCVRHQYHQQHEPQHRARHQHSQQREQQQGRRHPHGRQHERQPHREQHAPSKQHEQQQQHPPRHRMQHEPPHGEWYQYNEQFDQPPDVPEETLPLEARGKPRKEDDAERQGLEFDLGAQARGMSRPGPHSAEAVKPPFCHASHGAKVLETIAGEQHDESLQLCREHERHTGQHGQRDAPAGHCCSRLPFHRPNRGSAPRCYRCQALDHVAKRCPHFKREPRRRDGRLSGARWPW